jgi:hypothetical protein
VLAFFCFHHPSYLHSRIADSPTSYWRPFFSEAFSFSISKVRLTGRCGSLQARGTEKGQGQAELSGFVLSGVAHQDTILSKLSHFVGSLK